MHIMSTKSRNSISKNVYHNKPKEARPLRYRRRWWWTSRVGIAGRPQYVN
jgi:hypothetical protein